MQNECQTCATLWREYSTSTHAHIALESKLQIARLQHNEEAVRTLSSEVEAASRGRMESRRLLEQHENLVHPQSANTKARAADNG